MFLAVSIAQQCASIPTFAIRQSPRGCLLCLKWHRREADSVHLEQSKRLDNIVYWRAAMAECMGPLRRHRPRARKLRPAAARRVVGTGSMGCPLRRQTAASGACKSSVLQQISPCKRSKASLSPISQRPSPLHCCSPNHPRQSRRRCLACFARAPQRRFQACATGPGPSATAGGGAAANGGRRGGHGGSEYAGSTVAPRAGQPLVPESNSHYCTTTAEEAMPEPCSACVLGLLRRRLLVRFRWLLSYIWSLTWAGLRGTSARA